MFTSSGLSFDVKLSYSRGLAWIRPSDFLKAMVSTNDIKRILGGIKSVQEAAPILREFWRRFEALFPSHQVFSAEAGSLQSCVPIYVHGDEGTTFKRQGVLVMSWQSPFGHGSRHAPLDTKWLNNLPEAGDMTDYGIPVNFLRTALQNRFISNICPKAGPSRAHVLQFGLCWMKLVYARALPPKGAIPG